MKTWMSVLLSGFLLAGCGAAPTLTVAPAAEIQPTPKARHVLAATDSALWGINYTVKHTYGQQVLWTSRFNGKYWYDDVSGYAPVDDYKPQAAMSGHGELLKASYDRYVYRVPEGQVLVINHVEGNGTLYVNGFPLAVSSTSRSVQYLFGAGQLVTVKFAPTYYKHDVTTQKNNGHHITEAYSNTLAISGFTAEPSALSGLGGVAGK